MLDYLMPTAKQKLGTFGENLVTKVLVCQKNIRKNTIILSDILQEKLPKGMYILRILKDNHITDAKRFIVN